MKNFVIIAILITLTTGCEKEYKRATYRQSSNDTIEFLVANSDIIAVVDIIGGIQKGEVKKNSTFLTKSAKAKIDKILKGTKNSQDVIYISHQTLHNSPGDLKTLVSLRNGEYIAFLINAGEVYKPLTPFSLIEIYSSSNQGRPIWKQTESKYVDRPVISKDMIIKDILDEMIRQGKVKNQNEKT